MAALLQERKPLLESHPETGYSIQELEIINLARMCGALDVEYHEGVLAADFKTKDAIGTFCDFLDARDDVEEYEINIRSEQEGFTDYDAVPPMVDAVVIVYVHEDYITYGYEEYDEDEDSEDLQEVRRRIKVNSKGKRRIKMQCKPGFKWDATSRVCRKIQGAELAANRRSHRRAVLTKKAQGNAFKTRVLRKTRKALRFRKSMGLK